MSVRCKLGLHPWGGCKCHRCGKTRNKNHWWNNNNKGCKCSVCGKIRSDGWSLHEWRCCKCIICGEIRDINHAWHLDCTECPLCHKKGDAQHDWSKDCEKCSKCNQTRIDQHDYSNDVCSTCGKLIMEGYFIDNRDGKKYKWVRLGEQVLLMQNFAYRPESGIISGDKPDTRGYHYDWETALKVAPMGWHLPTEAEWLSVIDEFEKYGWKYFEQDNELNIRSHYLRNGYCDFNGKFYYTKDSSYWSATESYAGGAIGFCFPCWDDHIFEYKRYHQPFDRKLGLSVILFRDK